VLATVVFRGVMEGRVAQRDTAGVNTDTRGFQLLAVVAVAERMALLCFIGTVLRTVILWVLVTGGVGSEPISDPDVLLCEITGLLSGVHGLLLIT
jgi:hypothetical protein